MKNVFEAEGEIREVDPLAALVTCWREKSSGALRFARGGSESGFDLDQGEVVAVISSDPRFETAAILVRAGKLAADTIERLAPQGGDPALAALQTGLLTRREWKWGEKIRGIEVLSDLLAWNDGRYRFDAAAAVNAGDFRLPVPRLLLELFLRSRDRNLIDHQIGPSEQPLVRGERFDVEFPSFGLTADAESVVRLIDGRSTAAEIAEKAPAEEFAVRKLLAALVTLGLVHPVPVAPARPADRAPERDRAPEPMFPEAEPAVETPTQDFTAPLQVVPPGEETFSVDLPVDGEPESGPEGDIVELPAAAASPLDRFEPAPGGAWDPDPAPSSSDSGSLWGSSPDASALPEPPEADATPGRRGGAVAWGLGILVVAVAALILWRGRGPAPVKPAARAAATAIPAVTFPPPVTAPRPEPTQRALVAVGTARAAPTTAPTPAATSRRAPSPAATARPARPVAALAVTKPSPAAPKSNEPPAESREAWSRRAERDRRRLETERRTRFSIQLELVCEVPSLQEAWRHDREQSLWVLPVNHGGRDCFRVFWGRYPTIEAAKKAKSGIPTYFVTARNHPAVVSVR